MTPVTLRKGTPEHAKIVKRLQAGEEPRDIARTTCFTSAMIGAVKAHITMRQQDRKAGLRKTADSKDPKVRAKAVKMILAGKTTTQIIAALKLPTAVVSAIKAHVTRGHYSEVS